MILDYIMLHEVYYLTSLLLSNIQWNDVDKTEPAVTRTAFYISLSILLTQSRRIVEGTERSGLSKTLVSSLTFL